MTVKFWLTVGDRIGRVIDRAAEHDGVNRTAKAGQLLDSAVRSRLASGEYPESWGDEDSSTASHVFEHKDLVAKLLLKLASGQKLKTGDVAVLADMFDLSPADLAAFKEGNGHAAHANAR